MASAQFSASHPTGPQLLAEIRQAAEAAGKSPYEFMRPLGTNPWGLMDCLGRAKRPTPRTVERVRALVEGRALPVSDYQTTKADMAAKTVAAAEVLEQRLTASRAATERPRDGSTLADLVRALGAEVDQDQEDERERTRERELDELVSPSALLRRCQRDWPKLDARVRAVAAAAGLTLAEAWERVIGAGCLAVEDDLREGGQ